MLIVDVMNVVGTRPDGWWRDRGAAKRRLISRLQRYAASEQGGVTAVLDGRPLTNLEQGRHGRVDVLYARRSGRDAADDRIVECVEQATDRRAITVVTSDRALAQRVTALGAAVRFSGAFLRDLDAVEAGAHMR